MKISVLIPTYNSSKTIEATLNSVLSQTVSPDEILVVDDGSTDDTISVLNRYAPRVTIFQQRNGGVASARNVLVRHATGDLLAFLDHDDLWHPEYLAAQRQSFEAHPDAAGFFTAHKNFSGYGSYQWTGDAAEARDGIEVIPAMEFFRQYHKGIGKFGSMSFCCVSRSVIRRLGTEPFCLGVTGADDVYFFYTLMLIGSVIFNPRPLVAYRMIPHAQSASLLRSIERAILALKLLEPRFQAHPDARFARAFNAAFASGRREYARVLMGLGRVDEARKQLRMSFRHCYNPLSLAKSLTWYLLTALPARFQPQWPSEWKPSYHPSA